MLPGGTGLFLSEIQSIVETSVSASKPTYTSAIHRLILEGRVKKIEIPSDIETTYNLLVQRFGESQERFTISDVTDYLVENGISAEDTSIKRIFSDLLKKGYLDILIDKNVGTRGFYSIVPDTNPTGRKPFLKNSLVKYFFTDPNMDISNLLSIPVSTEQERAMFLSHVTDFFPR